MKILLDTLGSDKGASELIEGAIICLLYTSDAADDTASV